MFLRLLWQYAFVGLRIQTSQSFLVLFTRIFLLREQEIKWFYQFGASEM